MRCLSSPKRWEISRMLTQARGLSTIICCSAATITTGALPVSILISISLPGPSPNYYWPGRPQLRFLLVLPSPTERVHVYTKNEPPCLVNLGNRNLMFAHFLAIIFQHSFIQFNILLVLHSIIGVYTFCPLQLNST
jgi:hypothetical protein